MSNHESKISACKRIFRIAFRRRHAMHDRFQHVFHADAAFGADQQRIARRNRQHIFDLLFHKVGLRRRQIDFVDHRKNREVARCGEKRIRDGLRFHALARVHHEQSAFASRERSRHFVGKIHVPRRIDQVQPVGVSVFRLVVQADAFRFDGNSALALQVHGVEDLLVHLTLRERAGHFQQAVRQRGFAVIDVRDDTKIAYELWIHSGP